MMMEAIRLSLAAEEDRKRREDKEIRKEDKKKAKEDKKQAKRAEKLAKKRHGSSTSLYPSSTNDSTSSWAATSTARSTSNLGGQPPIPEERFQGKGKAPVQDFAGVNPRSESSSTLNTELREEDEDDRELSINRTGDPQGYLEVSRAHLQPNASSPIPTPRSRSHLRQLSNASSAASSFVDSAPNSLRTTSGAHLDNTPGAQGDYTPPAGTTPSTEPMFNFHSLAAMVGEEESKARESEHIEHAAAAAIDTTPSTKPPEELKQLNPHPPHAPSPPAPAAAAPGIQLYNRSRGDTGESSASAPPPIYVEHPPPLTPGVEAGGDQILPAPLAALVHEVDRKEYGDVRMLGHRGLAGEAVP